MFGYFKRNHIKLQNDLQEGGRLKFNIQGSSLSRFFVPTTCSLCLSGFWIHCRRVTWYDSMVKHKGTCMLTRPGVSWQVNRIPTGNQPDLRYPWPLLDQLEPETTHSSLMGFQELAQTTILCMIVAWKSWSDEVKSSQIINDFIKGPAIRALFRMAYHSLVFFMVFHLFDDWDCHSRRIATIISCHMRRTQTTLSICRWLLQK